MGPLDQSFKNLLQFKEAYDAARRRFFGILPTDNEMRSAFREHFIYFKPKDGLGGDFYTLDHNDGTILVVADCSGHSIEGALVAMLASGEVDSLVNTRGITEPRDIVKYLHRSMLQQWARTELGQGLGVSLEVSIIKISKDARQLSFCGAMRPLYLVRDGELIQYEKSVFSIGDHNYTGNIRSLEQHDIDLEPGDFIYLFTDGYETQPGDPDGKPLGKRRFRELIVRGSQLPLNEQAAFFDEEFHKFKGGQEQFDDICMIAVTT